MIKLYGIKSCDTVRKAIKQLDAQQTDYQFIDLKTTILSFELLSHWLNQCPDTLINKRSTTYRSIKDNWLAAENDADSQIRLIQQYPTLIKRPVIEKMDSTIIVGFDCEIYQNL